MHAAQNLCSPYVLVLRLRAGVFNFSDYVTHISKKHSLLTSDRNVCVIGTKRIMKVLISGLCSYLYLSKKQKKYSTLQLVTFPLQPYNRLEPHRLLTT